MSATARTCSAIRAWRSPGSPMNCGARADAAGRGGGDHRHLPPAARDSVGREDGSGFRRARKSVGGIQVNLVVIPGHREAMSPESITPVLGWAMTVGTAIVRS